MRTEQQLIERYNFLIQEEVKNKRLYGEISRYKRIIEIINGINPIEKQRTLKTKI
jgi:hypothetical protein